ncbi:MAG: transporter [Planctomycetes bacterium]|nr:transporter [Planctomycetota bacterium]
MLSLLHRWTWLLGCGLFGFATVANAQPAPKAPPITPPPSSTPTSPPPVPTPAPPADDGFSTLDSTVGYIDSALPRTQLRLRYDAAYDSNRPTRAEYFYAKPRPNGPGATFTERSIDYQEINAYGEALVSARASLFAEVPVRFLNPEFNDNFSGLSDVSFGGKYAFVKESDFVASLQVRMTAPTGAASQDLGTRHFSIEPGLLGWYRFADRWTLESELRYWVPIGGTNFAGDIIRYGLGISHNLYTDDCWQVAPVAEFVGWTVLGGRESVFTGPLNSPNVSAAGDTIVNMKVGLRTSYQTNDFYVGYGRVLTGERWYADVLRLEFRKRF